MHWISSPNVRLVQAQFYILNKETIQSKILADLHGFLSQNGHSRRPFLSCQVVFIETNAPCLLPLILPAVPIYINRFIKLNNHQTQQIEFSNSSFLKKPTMAARYNLRSISLPSRSHPTTLRIEEQLSKLNPLENSSPSTSKSISNGLLGLDDLYSSMDELLHLASTKQLLSSRQNRERVDELVDGFIKILDTCSRTRDMILQIQEQAQALQSALRRRKGDSSIRNAIANYTHLRKKTKKEAMKLISSTKQMDEKIGSTHLMNRDLHLYAVIRALKQSCFVTISIFTSLLSFMAIQSSKSKPNRWQLVTKVLRRRGSIACEEIDQINDEFGDVDAALSTIGDGVDAGKLQSARRSLEGLEIAMDGFENGLKGIFRQMIRTRASLLNLISQ